MVYYPLMDFGYIILIIFAAAIFGGLLLLALLRSAGLSPQVVKLFVPVHRKKNLLTHSEVVIYDILKSCKGDHYELWSQVAVTALVDGGVKSYFWGFMAKLQYKSVDYLLAWKSEDGHYIPRVAIELDDETHKLYHRIARDQYLEAALENAHIKLFRIRRRNSYNKEELGKALWDYIREKGNYRARVY